MRDKIFISYRRDDARGASGRLYDWLRIAFGRDRVFRDVHSIGIGNWRTEIDAALAQSAVLVVVIGPRWADPQNLPRLHDGNDMVRYEIVSALATSAVTIVPTLVEGATSPNMAVLPADLQPLGSWNHRTISEDGWEDDTRRLIAEIAKASEFPVHPDFERFLTSAGASQQRMDELPLKAEQITALRQTMDELTRKLAEASPTERPERARALEAVGRGDTRAAEQLFESEYEEQRRTAEDSRKRMAEAARDVANLALLHDISKAVVFYRKALKAEPEDPETARLLGYALLLIGDVRAAGSAMRQSLDDAGSQETPWSEMAGEVGLGDVLVAQGDGPSALSAYRKALAIGEALAARDRRTPSGNAISRSAMSGSVMCW